MSKTHHQATTADVLISGAGAAGLTMAIELARRNIAFRLIDKTPLPFNGSRGKGLQPRTLEIFEDMGVIDRILASGGPYPTQRSYSPDGYSDSETVEPSSPHPSEPYSAPLMLPQFLTEAILRERLAEFGHGVEYGCELTGFEQDEQGIVASVRSAAGEETIQARFLVGCDGGRSFVRHALNIDFPGETLHVRAIVADMVAEGLSRDFWHRWGQSPATSISLCPLQGTALFQLQAPIAMEGEPDLTASGLTRFITERTGRSDIVVHEVVWSSAYKMNARLADRYRVGRVFLAGDAAHIHPPTGGQGLNTSLQDAYNLGWKMAAVLQGAPATLLDTYEAERRPIAADMLGLSTQLLAAYQSKNDLKRGRDTQQLDLGYRNSPINLGQPVRRAGPHPGDRAPDAPVQLADGTVTRLFTLLHSTRWTLIAYEPGAAPTPHPPEGLRLFTVGSGGDVIDHDGCLREYYALTPGDWVLIRPDGYVAGFATNATWDAMHSFIEKWITNL